ncbi:MAG: ornithine carbamoyltransferase, partial [Deltaproteobacteria bacterium]|nr:ornithine carbamoyltransferase [Deltaproteobacteria bacterium]
MNKDLLTIKDLNKDDILRLIHRGLEIKKAWIPADRPLTGRTLGLMFDKHSTRTRVSFEAAMYRLGGQTLFLNKDDTQMSREEPIKDTARVLSRYLDALVIRTFAQEMVEEIAHWADIPVINALTDKYHPCQVLSDLMTVMEKKGALDNLKVAWIGDGNNVAHSWINAARILEFELMLACPPGYHPLPDVLDGSAENIQVVEDPARASAGADVINADVWTSMGQDGEREQRLLDFKGFQVNGSLLKLCKPDVLVLHCLPAHRGEEITDEVLEGPFSVVFDQAENKMHLHQALLEMLL